MESIYNLPYFLKTDEGNEDNENNTPITLTGVPEADWEILMQIDGEDLLRACTTNKYIAELCSDPAFWKRKIALEYNEEIASEALDIRGLSYQQYYKLISQNGEDIMAECSLNNWKFCKNDDFWYKKVSKLFGKEIADLNRMESIVVYLEELPPHYTQYNKMWEWYVRRVNPAPPGDPDYPPIAVVDMANLASDFSTDSDFEDLDVLVWLMSYNAYRDMMVDYIQIVIRRIVEEAKFVSYGDALLEVIEEVNLPGLIYFLYVEGFLDVNKDTHLSILRTYGEMIAMLNNEELNEKLVDSGILDVINPQRVALVAAQEGNINLLYEMYEETSFYDRDLNKIRRNLSKDVYENIKYADVARFAINVLGLELNDQIFDNAVAETSLSNIKDVYELGIRPGEYTFSIALNYNVGDDILDYLLEIDIPTESINLELVDVDALTSETISWLRRNKFGSRFGDELSRVIRDRA